MYIFLLQVPQECSWYVLTSDLAHTHYTIILHMSKGLFIQSDSINPNKSRAHTNAWINQLVKVLISTAQLV